MQESERGRERDEEKTATLPPPFPVLFLNVYTILSGILGLCAQKGRQSGTRFKAESEQQGPWALLYSSAGCLYQNVLCSCEPWQHEDQRKWGRERKAWDMQRKTNHVRAGRDRRAREDWAKGTPLEYQIKGKYGFAKLKDKEPCGAQLAWFWTVTPFFHTTWQNNKLMWLYKQSESENETLEKSGGGTIQ